MHVKVVGMQKHLTHTHVPEPPGEILLEGYPFKRVSSGKKTFVLTEFNGNLRRIYLCAVHTILHKLFFISLCTDIGVEQCEHTIRVVAILFVGPPPSPPPKKNPEKYLPENELPIKKNVPSCLEATPSVVAT